jgi:hypothetical protein
MDKEVGVRKGMCMSVMTFEDLLEQAKSLTPLDKIRLIQAIMASLKVDIEALQPKQPRRSMLGILADLGPAPSAEDIDEVRKEVWSNFPREDIS